jgi:hypothetical protein
MVSVTIMRRILAGQIRDIRATMRAQGFFLTGIDPKESMSFVG